LPEAQITGYFPTKTKKEPLQACRARYVQAVKEALRVTESSDQFADGTYLLGGAPMPFKLTRMGNDGYEILNSAELGRMNMKRNKKPWPCDQDW
jgi:hypothetical protein